MTNKKLQEFLKGYPEDMPIRLMPTSNGSYEDVIDLTEENILHTSETAFVNGTAPEDEWDTEDGKVELGGGLQYLLFNPIIQ